VTPEEGMDSDKNRRMEGEEKKKIFSLIHGAIGSPVQTVGKRKL